MASRARTTPSLSQDPEVLLGATREPDFRQERSRRSYLALIQAATELFATQPYDAVGTPEIAQRAGVAVGTFYRYFDDKRELYLEVARRTMVTGYRETIESLGPERFIGRARHETISETVAILFDHVLSRPQLMRSVNEMALRDPDVAELRQAFEAMSIQRLTALIATIVSRELAPDPEAIAYVLYGSAMQCAYGLAGHFGPAPISAERAGRADHVHRARAVSLARGVDDRDHAIRCLGLRLAHVDQRVEHARHGARTACREVHRHDVRGPLAGPHREARVIDRLEDPVRRDILIALPCVRLAGDVERRPHRLGVGPRRLGEPALDRRGHVLEVLLRR
ncbi:MAG: helix-turn-helix domain-containing protein [Kofleriaceae bacterium]